MADTIIKADNLSKVFYSKKGDVVAISDLTLTVSRGEIMSIVGASGCGKSTLLNIVAGFSPPTSGHVLFEDRIIDRVQTRCGMIFQSYALFPWMTVIENITFGPKLNSVPKKIRQKQAQSWISMVGLEGFESSFPDELSGGMKQRVALCRALANNPDVLLCDEPFAALDAMTRQVMQQELLQIVRRSGKTVLFVTHSIDEALILGDRAVVMSARPGRIKAVYDIDLPSSRGVDIQLTDRFLELKRMIWKQVEEEVMSSIDNTSVGKHKK